MELIDLTPIAEVVLKATEIRETSWDSERKYYSTDNMTAASKATEIVLGELNAEVAELVYLLIAVAWNDSLDLAKAIKANTLVAGQ